MSCELGEDDDTPFRCLSDTARSLHRAEAIRVDTSPEGDRSAVEDVARAYHERHAPRRREDGRTPA